MDDRNASLDMGVRVPFRGSSVGRPSCVPDSNVAGDAFIADFFDQPLNLPDASFQLNLSVVKDCNARGIVTSVLKPFKPAEYHVLRVSTAYVTDYSTHGVTMQESIIIIL